MKFCTSAYKVLLLIFTNRHICNKGAVVSGMAYFGSLLAIAIGCSAMKFCTSTRYFC